MICVDISTQMRNRLKMNASVVVFIACLIHINVFLASSLDLASPDVASEEEVETDRVDLPEDPDEFDMSYLECTSERCEVVKASTKELAKPSPWELEDEDDQSAHSRSKRRMFLPDNRLLVREQSVGRPPFNSAVAIRVNGEVKCSGVALLRPRFFLTAAHCVRPDGKKKDIEVGVLHRFREMQWAKVNNTRVPFIWRKVKRIKKKTLRLKDYAILETTTPLPVTPMSIGYVGADANGNEILQVNKTYMYLNAYDDERRSDDLNMRFCRMNKVKYHLIFSRCDTVPKTAGAGVYVRMRNKETGRVERKVIAIATGDFGVKEDQKYSVALRINSRMFPHICSFVTGSFNGCN